MKFVTDSKVAPVGSGQGVGFGGYGAIPDVGEVGCGSERPCGFALDARRLSISVNHPCLGEGGLSRTQGTLLKSNTIISVTLR